MDPMVREATVATEGNDVSTSFQSKDEAVRLWLRIVETSGIDDKVLADECEMSRGYFSKVSSGQQGDLLGLVYLVGLTRPALRRQFIDGLAALESLDPYTAAVESLHGAALRVLRLVPSRMAKADLLPTRKAAAR